MPGAAILLLPGVTRQRAEPQPASGLPSKNATMSAAARGDGLDQVRAAQAEQLPAGWIGPFTTSQPPHAASPALRKSLHERQGFEGSVARSTY